MIEINKEVSAYRAYLTLCNFKSSTVSAYCSTLEYYLEYHLATFGEEKPTQDHVQQYLLGRLDKGLSWSSINVDYSALRKYFRQLRDDKNDHGDNHAFA